MIALNQVHGGLLANAGDAGNIVRAVAHQRFQIDDAARRKAVLRLKHLRRVQDRLVFAHAGLHMADRRRIGDELQAVLIAGDDRAVPACVMTFDRDCPKNIVGLIARLLIAADAHGVQYLFEHRHLCGQVLGHRLALGLITVISLMAEGWLFPVKAYAQRIGLLLVQQMLQNIQKSKNGICRRSVRRIERPHPVIGAVNNAVAV